MPEWRNLAPGRRAVNAGQKCRVPRLLGRSGSVLAVPEAVVAAWEPTALVSCVICQRREPTKDALRVECGCATTSRAR